MNRPSAGRLRKILRRCGVDLLRYPEHHVAYKRALLLNHYGIDLVFDVGANDGGYGQQLREFGYEERLVSFEPLAAAYARLERLTRSDRRWVAINAALGDERADAEINVAANSTSSSFLPMREAHLSAAPWSRYRGTEKVSIMRLDDIFSAYCVDDRSLLKLDVQGYEEHVLRGAETSLPAIHGVQLEMSLVPLYAGSWGFMDAVEHFSRLGFDLVGLEPGFYNRATGRLLQVDGLFMRPASSA